MTPEGQHQCLHVWYAPEDGAGAQEGRDDGQHPETMVDFLAETGWAPASFQDGGKAGDAAAAVTEPGSMPDAGGTGDAAAPADAVTRTPGFVYDPGSGFLFDAASGYYHDANTGLYCHPDLEGGAWGAFDESGSFLPIREEETNGSGGATAGTAAMAVPEGAAGTSAGTHTPQGRDDIGVQPGHDVARPSQLPPSTARAMAPKKTGRNAAVIGAAPKLDSQGLLALARLSEERERRQQEKERKGCGNAAEPSGVGSSNVTGMPANLAPAAPVQGVLHRGKWANRGV